MDEQTKSALVDFASMLSQNPRARLVSWVNNMRRFDTPDTRILVSMVDNGVQLHLRQLIAKAFDINGRDGIVHAAEVKEDLTVADPLDVDVVSREDILACMYMNRGWIAETYSQLQLDWLWEFSWAYRLGDPKLFSRSLKVYARIRGPRLDKINLNISFQSVLNAYRKRVIGKEQEKLGRAILRASRTRDRKVLAKLGLSEEQIEWSINRVSNLSR